MYTSLDTQGRLSARLLSAQARSACLFFLLLLLFYSQGAYAHGVAEGDKGYIQEITGVNIIPFIYLGAKHMVTLLRSSAVSVRGDFLSLQNA